jgi:DNA-binding LacI/PurR family transcriptional regulator
LAAIVSELDSNLVEELAGNRIPLIFLDAVKPRRNVTNIRVNYRSGMEALLSYLYSLGHRRMGFLAHHNTFGPVNERMKVALESAAGYSDLHVSTAEDNDSLEGGRPGTRALLAADPKLTSVVCLNDLMAVGAMRELRESGIRVPQDVSISGFDNIEWAKFCHPALTSVHIPRDKIGQIICDFLIKSENPSLEQEFLIDPALIVRDSTGPAPGY